MSYDRRPIAQTLDPSMVMVVERVAYGTFAFPIGDPDATCVVMRYSGVRPVLGDTAVHEQCAVAVPIDSVVDVIESALDAAHRLFPGRLPARLRPGPGTGRPWITLSHCGVASLDDGGVVEACCPAVTCKSMVPVINGVLAEHDTNPDLGGGNPCVWAGVAVVDDRHLHATSAAATANTRHR